MIYLFLLLLAIVAVSGLAATFLTYETVKAYTAEQRARDEAADQAIRRHIEAGN